MTSKRKGGRRPGLERLEERLVLAQVPNLASQYLQGFVFSTPGAVIHVPGTYDPTIRQQVRFTNLAGGLFGYPALSAGANGAQAVVPLVLNPTTLTPVNTGLHVQVQTQATDTPTPTTVNAIYHLQSTPKPVRLRPAGIAAEVALINSIQQLNTAETTYAQIAAANPAATAAVALAFATDAVKQSALATLIQIDPLVRGQVPAVFIGTVGSLPVGVTANSLGLLDSLLFQASKAPNLSLTTQSDVVSQVTTDDYFQVSDATNGLASPTPSNAVGANNTLGFTALGATIAQVNLAAQAEGQAASQIGAALANPSALPSSIAATEQVFSDLNSSYTAQTTFTQFNRYFSTTFAGALQSVGTAGENYDTDVTNLYTQLFGVGPLVPIV